MTKQFRLPALFILLISYFTASAQNDSLINHNIKALQKYAAASPIEKVHLHIDRQLYFPGDTIWFKAYTVLGEYHKLSALSGILYVELINEKDSIVKRLSLSMVAGICNGDFALPFNFETGTFRIRAYTNWMRNASPAYFFNQAIVVGRLTTSAGPGAGKTGAPAKKAAVQTTGGYDVQFFPEGGELVNGLRSKVAFKVLNQSGLSEDVTGVVTDMEGNETATFSTQHLGMGLFPLTPQTGKQYQAKITCADGSTFTTAIPRAKDSGFILSVNNNLSDSLFIKVAANDVLMTSHLDTAFYLLAQSGGKYYFAAGRKLENKVFTATIAKDRFPSGIVQFTLFSQTGEPVNERIVFIQNASRLNLKLAPENQGFKKGEHVKFNLDAKTWRDSAATGTFSVSVIDETRAPVNEPAENTIFTDLLLKSELGGYIETPNYYFINPDDQTRADLDLLMLTQGYHRFEWKKILSGDKPEIHYKPEVGLSISGSLATLAGKPLPHAPVMVTNIKTHFEADTLTDENGKFFFSNLGLPDTAKVVVNGKKANGGNNVKISIDNALFPDIERETTNTANVPDEYKAQIRKGYAAFQQDSTGHVIQLKEVNIKEHKSLGSGHNYAVTLKSSANLNGPGMADHVLMADDIYMGCASLADCLPGRLPGVTFSNGVPYSLKAITRHVMGPAKPMAIYVDGSETPADMLNSINPADVHSIEVLTSAMFTNMYGTAANAGALIITLKNGSEISYQSVPAPGLLVYKFKGFYKAREFYSPKYTSANPVPMSDQRKTVFWAPGIITDANGKASFEYFNAGSAGNYRIVVEGIDGNGNLGRQIFSYKVEQ